MAVIDLRKRFIGESFILSGQVTNKNKAVLSPYGTAAVQRKNTFADLREGQGLDLAVLQAWERGQSIRDLYGDTLGTSVAVPADDLPQVWTGTNAPDTVGTGGGANLATVRKYLYGAPNANLADGTILDATQKDSVGQFIGAGNRVLKWDIVGADMVRVPSTIARYNTAGPMGLDTGVNSGNTNCELMAYGVFGCFRVTGTLFYLRCTKGSEFEIFVGANKEYRITGTPGASNGGSWSADGTTYTVDTVTVGSASIALIFPTDAERIVWLVPGSQNAGRSSPGGAWGSVYCAAGKTITPVLPGKKTGGVLADSWGGYQLGKTVVDRLSQAFNYEFVFINFSAGSTGYYAGAGTQPGASNPWPTNGQSPNFLKRFELDITAAVGTLDFFILGPALTNDPSGQMAQVAANFLAIVAILRARWPNIEIYVVGANYSVSQRVAGTVEAKELALMTAARALNTEFIPLYTNTIGAFHTGNGCVAGTYRLFGGEPRMPGSAAKRMVDDITDIVHPSVKGQEDLAWKYIAPAMVAKARRNLGLLLA